MEHPAAPPVTDAEREALEMARGLAHGEGDLAKVLHDLEQERERAANAFRAVVHSLTSALEARDGYTGEHSDAVHELSLAVARRLGMTDAAFERIRVVALLHDVGKIGIPDEVLHKPGPLTDAEWELMRRHPVIGERILAPLPGMGAVAAAIRHEHERWDGGGYPDGIAGEDIPLESRIVLACDAYHALVSDRPYRRARPSAEAREELQRYAGTQFDPAVIDALIECLDDESPSPSSADAPIEPWDPGVPAAGEERTQRLERELHALLSVASAVAAAHRLEDVLEVAAEAALEGIGAASLSVSRWEDDGRRLRTLINVGELGPQEARRPESEVYALDSKAHLRALLADGTPYTASLEDDGVARVQRELLEGLGKHSCAGVAVRVGGDAWGEVWAARLAGQPVFGERDVSFLQTISDQIAAAVGRAEVFSRMADLAFTDPLTGLANRRALEEQLEPALALARAEGRELAVLLCDIDRFKELNDLRGHAAGDAALERVGAMLRACAGGTVYRMGGDEFCVLVEDGGVDAARELGDRVLARLLASEPEPISLSCGVAGLRGGTERPADLLRAADAAQYTAKRTGRGRICVASDDPVAGWRASSRPPHRRALRDRPAELVLSILASTMRSLDDGLAERPALARLEHVVTEVSSGLGLPAGAVSLRPEGSDELEILYSLDRRSEVVFDARFGTSDERYRLTDYPRTAEALEVDGSFVVAVEDPAADPAERRLLEEFGMTAVLVAATRAPGSAWLVELYSDEPAVELEAVLAPLSLLVREAVRGAAPG